MFCGNSKSSGRIGAASRNKQDIHCEYFALNNLRAKGGSKMKIEHTERKGTKGLIIALLLAVIMIIGVAVSSEARLASTNRHAAVMEAYYALDPGHYGFSSKLINGSFVSDWNYIASDLNAYNKVQQGPAYPSGPTAWPSTDQSLFYTNVGRYGIYSNSGDSYGPIGRGGQCKFFVDTLLFRSEAASRINGAYVLPSYYDMTQKTRYIGYARPGDVIFISNIHTALVVAVLSGNSGAGTVTEVDVIDSNYIGTVFDVNKKAYWNEIIARHRLKTNGKGDASDLSKYKIYTGVSYYWENYNPY